LWDEVVRRIGRMQAEKLFTFTRDNAAPVGSRATATSLIAIRQPKITASRVKKIATEGVMDKDHAHNAKRGKEKPGRGSGRREKDKYPWKDDFLSGGADQSEEYLLNNNMMLVAAVVRRVQCAVLQCAVEC